MLADLFPCCRDGAEADKSRQAFASLDDETDDTSSIPDLDAPPDSDDGDDTGASTRYNHRFSSLFELVDDEQGVTVALLFNFLMVLFGLSSMNGPSRRKAIAAA